MQFVNKIKNFFILKSMFLKMQQISLLYRYEVFEAKQSLNFKPLISMNHSYFLAMTHIDNDVLDTPYL